MMIVMMKSTIHRLRFLPLFLLVVSLSAFADSPSIESGWTSKQLSNSTYTIYGHRYLLKDGAYFINTAEEKTSYEIIQSLIVSEDLNFDGIKDYVVFISSTFGGSGIFPLAIARLSVPGGWVDTDAFEMPDRVDVRSAVIHDGVLIMEMLVHRDGDAACCPSAKTTWKLRLEGRKLVRFYGRNDE
jgi:hypothetical protein